ncbi:MAG: hypothetical protein WAW52_13400 [Methanothrix sp.]
MSINIRECILSGHIKDLDEYFTVDDSTLADIRALAAGGASVYDMADQIQSSPQCALCLRWL